MDEGLEERKPCSVGSLREKKAPKELLQAVRQIIPHLIEKTDYEAEEGKMLLPDTFERAGVPNHGMPGPDGQVGHESPKQISCALEMLEIFIHWRLSSLVALSSVIFIHSFNKYVHTS